MRPIWMDCRFLAKNLPAFSRPKRCDIFSFSSRTIHPSKDFRRETPAHGYFFGGRLWNQPMLDEMSVSTGDKIDIVPVEDRSIKIRNDERNGSIAFYRLLPGWDGKPVARLIIRN